VRLLILSISSAFLGLAAGFYWHSLPIAGAANGVRNQETMHPDALSPVVRGASAERFLAALQQSGDVLRLEHDLWLAVEALGEDDLGIVSGDWAGILAVVERFKNVPIPTREAVFAAVVDKWLTLDPAGAMSKLGELSRLRKPGETIPDSVFAVLAKRQPQGLFDFVAAEKDPTKRDGLIYQAARALAGENYRLSEALVALLPENKKLSIVRQIEIERAKADPEFGIACVARADWAGNRAFMLMNAGFSMAKRGADAVGDALARNPQWSDIEREWFLGGLIDRDPIGAARVASDLPPEKMSALIVRRLAAALAGRDVARAEEWSAKLGGELRKTADLEIAKSLGAQEPQIALERLSASSDDSLNSPRRSVLDGWLISDEAAARAWIQKQPRESKDASILIEHLVATNRTTEASALLTASDARGAAAIAAAIAQRGALKAADWVTTLPAGAGQNAALRVVAGQFARDDLAGAEQWVGSFPAGTARDSAARTIAENLAFKQPQRASEWVDSIDDRWEKTRAATTVFDRWRWKDRGAAEAWLKALPGIYDTARIERLSGL
jgi:hypothetical protein